MTDADWITVEFVALEGGSLVRHVSKIRLGEVFQAPDGLQIFEATADHSRQLVRLTLFPGRPT